MTSARSKDDITSRARLSPSASIARIEVHLTATRLGLDVVDFVTEPLQNGHDRLAGLGVQHVIHAGHEERYSHRYPSPFDGSTGSVRQCDKVALSLGALRMLHFSILSVIFMFEILDRL